MEIAVELHLRRDGRPSDQRSHLQFVQLIYFLKYARFLGGGPFLKHKEPGFSDFLVKVAIQFPDLFGVDCLEPKVQLEWSLKERHEFCELVNCFLFLPFFDLRLAGSVKEITNFFGFVYVGFGAEHFIPLVVA